MKDLITIAVDAMGGDNAPHKIIDGIDLHFKSSNNIFYKIFGNKNIIEPIIKRAPVFPAEIIMSDVLFLTLSIASHILVFFPLFAAANAESSPLIFSLV